MAYSSRFEQMIRIFIRVCLELCLRLPLRRRYKIHPIFNLFIELTNVQNPNPVFRLGNGFGFLYSYD